MDMDIEKLALLKAVGGSGSGGGGSSVTVEPLTVKQNGTTTAPEGKAYSPVTVNVPVPQVFVAQKQVSGNRVIYDFGRRVEECAIGPIWSEFSKTGGGMSLSFGNPRVYNGDGSYDQGSFEGDGFRFTSSVVSKGDYPSMLVAVTTE